MPESGGRDQLVRLARIQAAYYIATGVLPLVSMRVFEAITGPKSDRWLVQTVGLLVTAIGSGLAVAGYRRQVSPELALIGAGSAGALAAIDVVYVAKRRISPVYLVDGAIEAVLVVAWWRAWQALMAHSHARPARSGPA